MVELKREIVLFLISIILGGVLCGALIPLLKRLKAGQTILGYVDNHKTKAGTPTMGGLSFAFAAAILFFAFGGGNSRLALIVIAVSFSFLAVGAMDDLIKIKTHKNEGLTALQKICFQAAISLIISCFIYFKGFVDFFVPFKNAYFNFGLFGAILCFFVFLATTNCVNLTDGLDGLAGGVSYVYLLVFYALIKIQILVFPENFVMPEECENVALLCLLQAGALLGYLCFNTNKATVFMGDTGSLYLGGFIACSGIICGNALFIPIIGVTFVASSVSVIMQVAHFKRTKKRIFLMAPYHHHLEYKGYSESKICYFYKIATLITGAACLAGVLS